MENNYKFFRNVDCEYYPCHTGIEPERFNCLFCYCPLYLLGDQCGGNFKFIGEHDRIKDCSGCNLPHRPEYYENIVKKLRDYNK